MSSKVFQPVTRHEQYDDLHTFLVGMIGVANEDEGQHFAEVSLRNFDDDPVGVVRLLARDGKPGAEEVDDAIVYLTGEEAAVLGLVLEDAAGRLMARKIDRSRPDQVYGELYEVYLGLVGDDDIGLTQVHLWASDEDRVGGVRLSVTEPEEEFATLVYLTGERAAMLALVLQDAARQWQERSLSYDWTEPVPDDGETGAAS